MVKGTVGLGLAVAMELNGICAVTGKAPVAMAFEEAKETTMPHISVKLWPGRTEAEKQRLADAIVEDVVRITGSSEASVSVSIEDVPSSEWKQKVYDPEIQGKAGTLYKKPGYSM